MLELIFSIALIVVYFAGFYFYLNKTINDYNRSLETNKTPPKSQSKRNAIKNEPCIDCL